MLHARTSALLRLAVAGLGLVCLHGAHAQSGPCPGAPISDHGQAAQGKPLASPPATAHVELAGKSVTIHYNAPSVRCRKIFGELVPYGKVWRTGANPATTLVTATNLRIGTLEVPAGTYTVYSLPAEQGTPWQLIINKQTGQWGTEYHEDRDLGRTAMKSSPVAHPQETMTIAFDHVHGKAAELHIRWADTDVYVPVEAQ